MKVNHRRCISCREVRHKRDFWRIVRAFPSHQIFLDEGMGRSAYLCPQAGCLRTARKKGKLGRALKSAIPEEIYQALEQRLATMN